MTTNVSFSVEDGFGIFADRTELSLEAYSIISRRQFEIERHLGQYITTFATVLPGAYARKTLAAPLAGNEVVLYVLFKQERSSLFNPDVILKKLVVTLQACYPQSQWSKRINAVLVPIEDIVFKVQPGFLLKKSAYLIPAPDGNFWQQYDCVEYKHQLQAANRAHDGKLVPIMRMIKAWNRVSGALFSDYYLEILVKEVFTNYGITSYADAIYYFFKRALAQLVFKKEDPANPAVQVEGLIDIENLVNAMLHINAAHQKAGAAILAAAEDNIRIACQAWGVLFPGLFPAPAEIVVAKLKTMGMKPEAQSQSMQAQ